MLFKFIYQFACLNILQSKFETNYLSNSEKKLNIKFIYIKGISVFKSKRLYSIS